MHFTSKLPQTDTTIFTIMSALAAEHNAINLSQGFPDFESSSELINLVTDAMKKGYNQYAPMPGVLRLREVISEKIASLYGVNYHPESEITITAGGTQAIFTILSAFVKPGDEVIVFKPAYDCYEPAIQLNGGKVIPIQLRAPDYQVNWNEVRSLINEKTKMVIINTPNNPSGTVFSQDDMKQLASILKDTNILLLSDEVYEHLIFDGAQHQSAARFSGLAERAFIVSSFGKTFHNTGWKVGYCVAPTALMKIFRQVHQFNVFCVNHPVQIALSAYLKNPETYSTLPDFFQQMRDFFVKRIETSRFKILSCQGTYFQLLDYSAITDEKDTDFAIRLTKEYKLASIPVSVFNENQLDQKLLRFCFAKKDETLEKAGEILSKI
ncbi:MAG: methionine aminotransferase [Flavobacteriaceae bacterium]|nr:methionine aminotransferase [Flavobacteriaceae bacterium]MDZ4147321.1 methionine aminotransferase [Flavobacteriaceae bacterium]